MIKGDIEERSNEHGNEVEKNQVSTRRGCEADTLAWLAIRDMREKGMIDRLPMLGREVGIAGGAQQRWGEEKQHNDKRAKKNDDWENQQLLVPGDDRERTLQ